MIVITCDQGYVNVTSEGCSPRRCQPFQSLTVRLGEYSVSASPLAIIVEGSTASSRGGIRGQWRARAPILPQSAARLKSECEWD